MHTVFCGCACLPNPRPRGASSRTRFVFDRPPLPRVLHAPQWLHDHTHPSSPPYYHIIPRYSYSAYYHKFKFYCRSLRKTPRGSNSNNGGLACALCYVLASCVLCACMSMALVQVSSLPPGSFHTGFYNHARPFFPP
jgi:hypothetical protein